MTTKKTTEKPRAAKKAVQKSAARPVARATQRAFTGVVMRISGAQTVRVEVQTIKTHSKFRKQYATKKAYLVHDENNMAKVGDVVIFEECRPISKQKRWRIRSIVAKA